MVKKSSMDITFVLKKFGGKNVLGWSYGFCGKLLDFGKFLYELINKAIGVALEC